MVILFFVPGVVAGVALPLASMRVFGHGQWRGAGASLLVMLAVGLLGLLIGLTGTKSAGQANWDALLLIVAVFSNGALWLVATLLTAGFLSLPNAAPVPPAGPNS